MVLVFWFLVLVFSAPVVQRKNTGLRTRGSRVQIPPGVPSIKLTPDGSPNFFLVTGKGGVGKSTFSVILANFLSKIGKVVLYYPTENPSPSYSFLNDNVIPYPLDFEVEAKNYVKMKLKFFFFWFPLTRSSVFRIFSKVIPGFRELIMLGKMWYDRHTNKYDFYVFDGLPTGQIISMLKIPQAALVSGAGGFARSDLEGMDEFVRRKIDIFVVTLPEHLSFAETEEALHNFEIEGFRIKAIVLNKFYTRRLHEDDISWLRTFLIEGKLNSREKKEIENLLKFDSFFSQNSENFLRMYEKFGYPVLKINLSIPSVDRESIFVNQEVLRSFLPF